MVAAAVGASAICVAAGPASGWVNHPGSSASQATLNSAGAVSVTVSNPTPYPVRCSINFYTAEAEPELRAATARINQVAPAVLAGGDVDALIEYSSALTALSPRQGAFVAGRNDGRVNAGGSQVFNFRVDAPVAEKYVGSVHCDNYADAATKDLDAAVVVATKSGGTGGGGSWSSLG